MNLEEKKYLELLQSIVENGSDKSDRTGTGTKSIFGTTLRFSLKDNKVPVLTTKKMFLKGIIEELLFFIRGETNTKLLEEKGVNIWKGNTSREFLDKKGLGHLPEGSLGYGYGWQWRNFNGTESEKGVDQLSDVIEQIKSNPDSRRHLVIAWNPSQLKDMALEPCHMMFQFYVCDGELSLLWYQRSVDTFLGLPFNILSYAILTRLVAEACSLKAKEIVFMGGDTHVYTNHLNAVSQQVVREPYDFPTMEILDPVTSLQDMEKLSLTSFVFNNYKCYASIKAEMAV